MALAVKHIGNSNQLKLVYRSIKEPSKTLSLEASKIKIRINTGGWLEGTSTTYSYFPDTLNLHRYLVSYTNLKESLATRAVVKGILTGTPLGLISGIILILNKKFKGECFLTLLATSLFASASMVFYENQSTKDPEPYFDPCTLKKNDNIFSNANLITVDRVCNALAVAALTHMLSTYVVVTSFEKIQEFKSK